MAHARLLKAFQSVSVPLVRLADPGVLTALPAWLIAAIEAGAVAVVIVHDMTG